MVIGAHIGDGGCAARPVNRCGESFGAVDAFVSTAGNDQEVGTGEVLFGRNGLQCGRAVDLLFIAREGELDDVNLPRRRIGEVLGDRVEACLLYTSPSPRDRG